MKNLIRYVKCFCITIIILMTLLFAVSAIPQKYCRENIRDSYDGFLKTDNIYKMLIQDRYSTMIDIHADSIWLNIVNYIDDSKPVSSALEASYYIEDSDKFTQFGQVTAIDDDIPANKTYERYWHGVIIYLKPLLVLTDINGVRIFQYVVLTVLLVLTGYLMAKRKLFNMLISFFIGMAAISIWIVPYGLEFFPAFAVMLSLCIYILLSRKRKIEDYMMMFFISGILISFFDFLTVELLTLLIPYMLIMCIYIKDVVKWNNKEHILYLMRIFFLWGAGYAATFITKWTIASVVLHKNAFETAIKSAEVRTFKKVTGSIFEQWRYAITRNIRCLLPLDFLETYGELLVFILGMIFVIVVLLILFGKKQSTEEKFLSKVYFLIGIIPFIRFSILINHSYLHCFFTYRVLLVNVVGVSYFILTHLKFMKKS